MPDFRFRLPAIDELKPAQRIAYSRQDPILVTGGPGSGKTVVSIFRYLRQIGNTQNALFFTFNRTLMSSIRGTLRQRADTLLPDLNEAQVEAIIENNIGSIFEWYANNFHTALSIQNAHVISTCFLNFINNQKGAIKFDELFIDEAQDLKPDIISSAYQLAESVTCGADRSQDLQGHYMGPADEQIYNILNLQKRTYRQGLTQNFRNTRQIFEFARNFVKQDIDVQNIDTTELEIGEEPEVLSNKTESEQLQLIKQIIDDNLNSNIGILVHSKKEVDKIRDYLRNYYRANNIDDFSYYYSKMDSMDQRNMENRLKTPFILTYESCKGLEFDIVIMPFFDSSLWALTKYKKENDGSIKKDVKGNPMTWAIPNHYYVGATRAKRLLYVMYNTKPPILTFYDEKKQTNLFDI